MRGCHDELSAGGSKAPALLYKFSAAGVLSRCVGLLQGWKCWQTGGKGRFAALPWVWQSLLRCFAWFWNIFMWESGIDEKI